MATDIQRWIVQFLVRSSVPDELLNRIIAVIPLNSVDPFLQKALLLRVIQSHISIASVPEKILQILEFIEELDRLQGMPMMDSMKAAYCAVSVENTVKYTATYPNTIQYLLAVERIWRSRVSYMAELKGRTELVSDELKQWREVIETALLDSKVYERLGDVDTRKVALKKLNSYLREAQATMGSSFLEGVAGLIERSSNSEGEAGR